MNFGMSKWLREIQVERVMGKVIDPALDALLGRAV
jgi:hypothetical protein